MVDILMKKAKKARASRQAENRLPLPRESQLFSPPRHQRDRGDQLAVRRGQGRGPMRSTGGVLRRVYRPGFLFPLTPFHPFRRVEGWLLFSSKYDSHLGQFQTLRHVGLANLIFFQWFHVTSEVELVVSTGLLVELQRRPTPIVFETIFCLVLSQKFRDSEESDSTQ